MQPVHVLRGVSVNVRLNYVYGNSDFGLVKQRAPTLSCLEGILGRGVWECYFVVTISLKFEQMPLRSGLKVN